MKVDKKALKFDNKIFVPKMVKSTSLKGKKLKG